MSLVFPPKITSVQLKSLARLCGRTRSGTKAAIQERIVDGLKDFEPLAPGTRVLSIDLGIRNLAYSLLEVPESDVPSGTRQRGRRKDAAASLSRKPTLHAWERLALIPKIPKPAKSKKKSKKTEQVEVELESTTEESGSNTATKPKKKKTRKATPHPESDDQAATLAAALSEAADDPTTTPVVVEDFSPARLSSLAVDLITDRLLPLRPNIVIMEQQRFRSMGGSAVLEWTLRVNSLESMLYAVFTTMKSLGKWPGGRLEGVVARNVLEFMATQEAPNNGNLDIWDKEKVGDNKKIKKDIVGRILQSRNSLQIAKGADAVEEIAKEYLEKWERTGKRGKANAATSVKKMDDLADCLLQGLAFIRWQENKRKLLTGGVEALNDQMVAE